jgi:hypothetical protein
MAIYIQQTPEQTRNSFNLQRHAEIVAVLVSKLSAIRPDTVASITGKLGIRIAHTATARLAPDRGLLTEVAFIHRIFPEGDEHTDLFKLDCIVQLTYSLDEGYTPTETEIEAFSTANAVFNSWPFFREITQTVMQKMGLPPIPTLPFLRLVTVPVEKEPATQESQSRPARRGRRKVPTKSE